jgi:hypothetical protein
LAGLDPVTLSGHDNLAKGVGVGTFFRLGRRCAPLEGKHTQENQKKGAELYFLIHDL